MGKKIALSSKNSKCSFPLQTVALKTIFLKSGKLSVKKISLSAIQVVIITKGAIIIYTRHLWNIERTVFSQSRKRESVENLILVMLSITKMIWPF